MKRVTNQEQPPAPARKGTKETRRSSGLNEERRRGGAAKSSRAVAIPAKPAGRRVPGRPSKTKKKSAGRRFLRMRNILVFATAGVAFAAFYYFIIGPYFYCSKAYGVCIPGSYQVHGIDISHYQGRIDWGKLKKNKETDFPLRFIFMKATEGGDLDDDTFKHNFDQARRHGFIRGAYHFFIPRTDPLKQADFFIRTVKLDRGDLPPVLDVEVTAGKPKKELQRNVRKWLERVEAHYGVKPILYTSYRFKTSYLDDPFFNAYPYWIAHYYVDSVQYEGKWHFWQHTDAGRVPGIRGLVDLNVFNGTIDELRKLTLR